MTDIEMLPLPEYLYGREASDNERVVTVADAHAYAVRNVAHATAAKDAEIESLRAELREMRRTMAGEFKRAERLAEALRGLMLNSPGGHSCEEFHHYKSDRHMPGDDCPVQLRWNKAVTTAQSALRDHDKEGKDG